MDEIIVKREIMKSGFIKGLILSDQSKGLPQPPLEKPHDEEFVIVDLPEVDPGSLRRQVFLIAWLTGAAEGSFPEKPFHLLSCRFCFGPPKVYGKSSQDAPSEQYLRQGQGIHGETRG